MNIRKVGGVTAGVAALLLGWAPLAQAAPATPTSAPSSVAVPTSPASGHQSPTSASPTSAAASSSPAVPTPAAPSATTQDPTCDQMSMMCSGGAPALVGKRGGARSGGGGGSLSSNSSESGAASDDWAYINSVAPLAISAMNRYRVPASVTIAQSILESGWGTSGLTVQGHAYFGIKCDPSGYRSSWQSSCLGFPTQEWDGSKYITIYSYFRGYNSASDSFMDHGLFLNENGRYAPAFSTTNADDFIRAVARAGYATDPAYANSVISIMQAYNLYMYDTPGWQIQAYYGSLGGSSSYLGTVNSGINCGLRDGGCFQVFSGGTGYWSPNTPATAIPVGPIRDRYAQLGNENSRLGYPTGPQVCNGSQCYQFFQNGAIYYSPSTGAWENVDFIRARYKQLGSEWGHLGLPTGPQVCNASECYQFFQGGVIYYSASTGAWENVDFIRARYQQLGSEWGHLGLPTGPQVCSNGNCYQFFQGGVIYYSPSTGAWENVDFIRGRYTQIGSEWGVMGFPTGPQVCSSGNCYQFFQGGVIYWSPTTGAWETTGPIRGRYTQIGSEWGVLGRPTGAPTCGIKNNGCYQFFQGGVIYWSSTTGAWETTGPLRAYYAANGSEHGSLGLPTGPVVISGATQTQRFEGGTLTWTAAGGVRRS